MAYAWPTRGLCMAYAWPMHCAFSKDTFELVCGSCDISAHYSCGTSRGVSGGVLYPRRPLWVWAVVATHVSQLRRQS
eukprot:1075864-Lingulodinium_polyedra.AAC.1